MGRLLDALTGKDSSTATREAFKQRFREGSLDNAEIELELEQAPQMPFEIPGGGAQMINLSEMMGKAFGGPPMKRRKLSVRAAWDKLVEEEADKRLDQDEVSRIALADAEANGIVFLDEIDKICKRGESSGPDVSREGVQRDLLPLVEGCTVNTKHGMVKTDHILFVASGAFQIAKPSDLIPELQGRLPIRVELTALTTEDFERILTEPNASLTDQYKALMATEGVNIEFTQDGIRRLAEAAWQVNERTENIGARRLHTVMERLMEDISYDASEKSGETFVINTDYVNAHLGKLIEDEDLSRFIL